MNLPQLKPEKRQTFELKIMNAKQTIPALVKFAPAVAAVAPPVLIFAALGAALVWLLSRDEDDAAPETPLPVLSPTIPLKTSALSPTAENRRMTREDIAEALEYGSRAVPRGEAVAKLQALGFGKTAAYKALSPSSRFAEFIEIAPDGLIEWKG